MANSASIKIGENNGYSWIKINGRGDVFLTPTVKKFTESVFTKLKGNSADDDNINAPKFVFDMEDCTGMDSTFMGMIAGLAIKLQGVADSCFQLCSVSSSNTESLEELGIDSLVQINPSDAEWSSKHAEIREKLTEWSDKKRLSPDKKLILDTHETLGSMNDKNKKEFSSVIKTFKSEVEE